MFNLSSKCRDLTAAEICTRNSVVFYIKCEFMFVDLVRLLRCLLLQCYKFCTLADDDFDVDDDEENGDGGHDVILR